MICKSVAGRCMHEFSRRRRQPPGRCEVSLSCVPEHPRRLGEENEDHTGLSGSHCACEECVAHKKLCPNSRGDGANRQGGAS